MLEPAPECVRQLRRRRRALDLLVQVGEERVLLVQHPAGRAELGAQPHLAQQRALLGGGGGGGGLSVRQPDAVVEREALRGGKGTAGEEEREGGRRPELKKERKKQKGLAYLFLAGLPIFFEKEKGKIFNSERFKHKKDNRKAKFQLRKKQKKYFHHKLPRKLKTKSLKYDREGVAEW